VIIAKADKHSQPILDLSPGDERRYINRVEAKQDTDISLNLSTPPPLFKTIFMTKTWNFGNVYG